MVSDRERELGDESGNRVWKEHSLHMTAIGKDPAR